MMWLHIQGIIRATLLISTPHRAELWNSPVTARCQRDPNVFILCFFQFFDLFTVFFKSKSSVISTHMSKKSIHIQMLCHQTSFSLLCFGNEEKETSHFNIRHVMTIILSSMFPVAVLQASINQQIFSNFKGSVWPMTSQSCSSIKIYLRGKVAFRYYDCPGKHTCSINNTSKQHRAWSFQKAKTINYQ